MMSWARVYLRSLLLATLSVISGAFDVSNSYNLEGCDAIYADANSTARLQCLQYHLGNEANSSRWSRGYVDQSSENRSLEHSGYLYQTCRCPLTYFSEEGFCKIVENKHILAIGDSTMEKLVMASRHIFTRHEVLTNSQGYPMWCPTNNGCYGPARAFQRTRVGCHNDDRETSKRPLMHLDICKTPTGKKGDTTISYIRHDYIYGHHGRTWNKNSVCDYWTQIIQDKDYILTTFGAHLPEVLSNPWGRMGNVQQMASFDEGIVRNVSRLTAIKIKELMKHSATVVFIGGNRGVSESHKECDFPPDAGDVDPSEQGKTNAEVTYHWNNIQKSNTIYMETFKEVFGSRMVVLDVLNLFQRMRGCRQDGLHFRADVPATPKNIIWQIIYNVLVEMENGGRANVHESTPRQWVEHMEEYVKEQDEKMNQKPSTTKKVATESSTQFADLLQKRGDSRKHKAVRTVEEQLEIRLRKVRDARSSKSEEEK